MSDANPSPADHEADWQAEFARQSRAIAPGDDEAVTGARPGAICPGRPLGDEQATPAVLSFGDGHHRCPGSHIAVQESDVFPRQLLALPGLRPERAPTVTRDDLTAGHALRACLIADEPGAARRERHLTGGTRRATSVQKALAGRVPGQRLLRGPWQDAAMRIAARAYFLRRRLLERRAMSGER